MIPGVNPRQLKQMMKQMGMSQTDIVASEVIIKTKDTVISITNPSVQKVVMQGQTTFQISGNVVESQTPVAIAISDEDIEMVSEQSGVSRDEAKLALEKTNGDIAEAIVNLS